MEKSPKRHTDAYYRKMLSDRSMRFTQPGCLIDLQYRSSGDWYARTIEGWWWYSGREGWKFCPMGPL